MLTPSLADLPAFQHGNPRQVYCCEAHQTPPGAGWYPHCCLDSSSGMPPGLARATVSGMHGAVPVQQVSSTRWALSTSILYMGVDPSGPVFWRSAGMACPLSLPSCCTCEVNKGLTMPHCPRSPPEHAAPGGPAPDRSAPAPRDAAAGAAAALCGPPAAGGPAGALCGLQRCSGGGRNPEG